MKFGRQQWLVLALVATLALTGWALFAPSDAPDVVVAVAPRAGRSEAGSRPASGPGASAGPGEPASPTAGKASPPGAAATSHNIFPSYSLQPAPPPTRAASSAPAGPVAPAPAFVYIGRIIDGESTVYLLLAGEAPLRLAPGDRSGDYQLVEARAGEIVFLHVPTGQQVAIPAPSLK